MRKVIDQYLSETFLGYDEHLTERHYKANVIYKDGTMGVEYVTKPMPRTVYELDTEELE